MKILELILAILISALLFPIALIFNILTFWKLKKFWRFSWKMTFEVILVIYDLFEILAVVIDRIGNVIAGNLFIILFVQKKFRNKTLFGKNKVTISASLGHSLEWIYLNKYGVKFAYFLNKIFKGSNHCQRAYEWYLIKKNFNKKTI